MSYCGDCKDFDESDVIILVSTFSFRCKKKPNTRVSRYDRKSCFEREVCEEK
jgi:hypothetical protein